MDQGQEEHCNIVTTSDANNVPSLTLSTLFLQTTELHKGYFVHNAEEVSILPLVTSGMHATGCPLLPYTLSKDHIQDSHNIKGSWRGKIWETINP